uniref:Maternally-expressed gene (MEG)/Ae1-like cystein-rich peptide n=1 Tax=Torenia fournieri TaxID=68875 RepID=C0A020_9LAMI|nr:maternally-expressed gene (MEG)/Ae1-like cystein-rich peptide [Torenia fournieri]
MASHNIACFTLLFLSLVAQFVPHECDNVEAGKNNNPQEFVGQDFCRLGRCFGFPVNRYWCCFFNEVCYVGRDKCEERCPAKQA